MPVLAGNSAVVVDLTGDSDSDGHQDASTTAKQQSVAEERVVKSEELSESS